LPETRKGISQLWSGIKFRFAFTCGQHKTYFQKAAAACLNASVEYPDQESDVV
jgi:hypothetical protein